jgi:HK97 family phage major capsid protein
MIWQVPVIATPSMPEDSFLVGPFRTAAMLVDRMDPTAFISDSHSDYFIKNLLAVLLEERVALINRVPTAFVTGDFGLVT